MACATSPPADWRVVKPVNPLYLLVLIAATGHLAHDGARFAVTLYAVRLGISPAVIGTLGAMFALLPALTSLAIGRWIDRIGARGPMLVCAVMMIAGCALPFFHGSVVTLFITSTVVGTFYNASFIAASRMLGQLGAPGKHVRNIGVSSTGYSIATLLAPLAAGFAIDAWGHANTFLLLALLPLLPLAILGTGTLRFPERRRRAGPATDAPRVSVLGVVERSGMRSIFIANICSQVAWSLYVFLMPIYGSEIGMSASAIGLVMSGFSLTTVLIRSVLPVFVRRLTPWQVLLLSLAGASLCLAAFPFFSSFTVLMVLGILLGVGLGLSGPMTLSLIYEHAPPERLGELLGLRITLMNVSFAGVPFLSGTITAAVGVGPVFWLLAAGVGASCAVIRKNWRAPRHASR